MDPQQLEAGDYTLDATEDVIISPKECHIFEVEKWGHIQMVFWVVVQQEGGVKVLPKPAPGEHAIGKRFLIMEETERVREGVEMPASCQSCLAEDQKWLSLPAVLVEDTPQLLHGKRTLLFAEERYLCD